MSWPSSPISSRTRWACRCPRLRRSPAPRAGWTVQAFWGSLSDRFSRKASLTIIALGSAVTLFAMMFIHSAAPAWVVLIGCGLFRNSPCPVLRAAMIDTMPDAASSVPELMIGTGLGRSGVIATPVDGFIIDHAGFTTDYLALTAVCLIARVPIALLRETSHDADTRHTVKGQT